MRIPSDRQLAATRPPSPGDRRRAGTPPGIRPSHTFPIIGTTRPLLATILHHAPRGLEPAAVICSRRAVLDTILSNHDWNLTGGLMLENDIRATPGSTGLVAGGAGEPVGGLACGHQRDRDRSPGPVDGRGAGAGGGDGQHGRGIIPAAGDPERRATRRPGRGPRRRRRGVTGGPRSAAGLPLSGRGFADGPGAARRDIPREASVDARAGRTRRGRWSWPAAIRPPGLLAAELPGRRRCGCSYCLDRAARRSSCSTGGWCMRPAFTSRGTMSREGNATAIRSKLGGESGREGPGPGTCCGSPAGTRGSPWTRASGWARSARCVAARLRWVVREPGSAARQCLDELLGPAGDPTDAADLAAGVRPSRRRRRDPGSRGGCRASACGWRVKRPGSDSSASVGRPMTCALPTASSPIPAPGPCCASSVPMRIAGCSPSSPATTPRGPASCSRSTRIPSRLARGRHPPLDFDLNHTHDGRVVDGSGSSTLRINPDEELPDAIVDLRGEPAGPPDRRRPHFSPGGRRVTAIPPPSRRSWPSCTRGRKPL